MAKSKAQKENERKQREKAKTVHWLIVYKPWFVDHYRRKATLTEVDLQTILWWLSLALRCPAEKINAIQHQTNRSYIVAKVDLDVDVHSRLGEYRWQDFLVRPSDSERNQATRVLEYNYLDNGDPSENQWKEDFPEIPRRPPFQFVRRDFPDPTWCDRPRVEPFDWFIPLPQPATSASERGGEQQVDQITTENTVTPVRLPSRPPTYSSASHVVASDITSERDLLPTFRPYQSALRPLRPDVGDHRDEKKEQLMNESQLISITNPYGVDWSDEGQPNPVDIWNWLQLIVDGPEELFIDIPRKRVIVRIKEHVSLVGVLGRHLWRNFLKDCSADVLDEVSLVVRAKEEDVKDLQKVDIPDTDENYDAFAPDYPHPDPFMNEFEDSKDTKVKGESKDQAHQKVEVCVSSPSTNIPKRETSYFDEENDRKRVKME